MAKTKKEIVKLLLNKELSEEDDQELLDLLIEQPIAIDVDKAEDARMSTGDRIADRLSEIAGSWGFIIGFILFLLGWIILNYFAIIKLDEFPFILLNLLLSCLAALQAPIIMMSQNRQAHKDSIRNQNDYRTDLKSELISEEILKRLEEISKNERKIIRMLEGENDEDKKN